MPGAATQGALSSQQSSQESQRADTELLVVQEGAAAPVACDSMSPPGSVNLTGPCDRSRDDMPSELDDRAYVAAVLDSADAASAQGRSTDSVRVDRQVLAGTVPLNEDALAAAAGLDNKQCRMM